MRDLVKEGYNNGNYEIYYSRNKYNMDNFEKSMCDELILRLKEKSKILDLGCGTGLPYDKYFADKKFKITGVDLSTKHIAEARKNVRSAKYILGDFFSNKINEKYDAIISFYSIFHIPRKEHKKLLEHAYSLLNKEGFILITLGTESMKFSIDNNFAGSKMAWSSFSSKKNKNIIQKLKFKILISAEDFRDEKHLWILAKKN